MRMMISKMRMLWWLTPMHPGLHDLGEAMPAIWEVVGGPGISCKLKSSHWRQHDCLLLWKKTGAPSNSIVTIAIVIIMENRYDWFRPLGFFNSMIMMITILILTRSGTTRSSGWDLGKFAKPWTWKLVQPWLSGRETGENVEEDNGQRF